MNNNEWVSVNDGLPERHVEVLIYPGYIKAYLSQRPFGTYQRWFNSENDHVVSTMPVTHWMPLPKPPEPQLKPCPFCGNNVKVFANDNWSYVACTYCDARGPEYTSSRDAIIGWNNRTGASE